MGRRVGYIINKQETRHVCVLSNAVTSLYLRCNILPTASIFFIPLLDLLVLPSPDAYPESPLLLLHWTHTSPILSPSKSLKPRPDSGNRNLTEWVYTKEILDFISAFVCRCMNVCGEMASMFNRRDFIAQGRKNFAGLEVGGNIGKIFFFSSSQVKVKLFLCTP